MVIDHLAARVCDQAGQQVGQDRAHHRRDGRVRRPAHRNEERSDDAPRDDRRNIGHDHAGQERAELLHRYAGRTLLRHYFRSHLTPLLERGFRRDLAVCGPDQAARWVSAAQQANPEPHAKARTGVTRRPISAPFLPRR